MSTNLTANETKVMAAVIKSARGNGYDFGFTCDVVKALRSELTAQQVGALLTTLQAKGQITVHDPVTTNAGTMDATTYTQITLNDELRDRLCDERDSLAS